MISRIAIEDKKALLHFVECSIKECNDIGKKILTLEVSSEFLDIKNELIKSIQRVKRGASFFGLCHIHKALHEMETVLEYLHQGKDTPKTEFIDHLCSCVDLVHMFLVKLMNLLKGKSFRKDKKYLDIELDLQELNSLEQLSKYYQNHLEKYTQNENTEENDDLKEEFQIQGFEDEIREQFLIETAEYLDTLENDMIIRLDSNADDRDAVIEMFRILHSIKGGTGIYLSTLTVESWDYEYVRHFMETVHNFEELLSTIRDSNCAFDSSLVDMSLQLIDYLKLILQVVSNKEEIFKENETFGQMIAEKVDQLSVVSNQNDRIFCDNQDKEKASNNLKEQPLEHRQKKETKSDENTKGSLSQSIRVNQEKIDAMMNIISELIIAKNSFSHISDKLIQVYNLPGISNEIKQLGANVTRISDELQNSIMSIRMVEIKTVFQKMPRVIRDIAHSTGKKIELIMEGDTTEIDKSIIEQISDPLVHMIRNSADHGIESVEERRGKGKPETGKVTLRAYNKNKYVFIEVEDDGKGMDAEKIKTKAIEKGLISEQEAERMSKQQLLNLIFLPGFSMASKVTEVSGRGVGMDIVKSNITNIHGTINIESSIDVGTKMIIRLPLSLAVSHGLIVETAKEHYIIPIENIVETVKICRSNIHMFQQKYFIHLREEVIGIDWLQHIFQLDDRDLGQEEYNAVIISNGIENFALIVDKLKNEQEFVMKTLEGHLSNIPGISGSTLLGNGQVVLIVNPTDIIRLASA